VKSVSAERKMIHLAVIAVQTRPKRCNFPDLFANAMHLFLKMTSRQFLEKSELAFTSFIFKFKK
jgi:hypothetical protein